MNARIYRTDEQKAQALAALRSILTTMERMLDGSLPYIEGSQTIARLRFDADVDESDPDILPFVGVDSETESLPIGDKRKLWSAANRKRLQPRIDEAERWAKGILESHCRNFIQRFGAREE
jgi:hypothetical protein